MARRILPLLLALAATAAWGGQAIPAPRKRIVLALAGGGAYGLMDLGALEWLERHRIPVDAIAGTSGGALVGGWYATGLEMLSDEEILHPQEPRTKDELRLRGVAPVIAQVDFDHLFDSQPDYRNLSIPQKEERRLFPNDLFAGLSRRALRRDGLIPGQTIGFFLDYIGRDYPRSFDTLPIPFRAVATEAPDGDPNHLRSVVLGGPKPEIPLGLSRAIRASIAVPILFAPEKENGHRLIDGAVRDNFPSDAAIDAFDPDVLIGLRWDSGYGPDPYRPGRGGREPREKTIVTFDPRPYSVADFGRWRELAWIGYQGMEAQRTALERYALSPEAYLAYRHAKKAVVRSRVVRRVTGDAGAEARLDEVRRAAVGKDLDDFAVTKALGQALDRVVAEEGLATAGYDLLPDGTLHVRTTRHSGGPPFVREGVELDENSGGRLWGGLRGRISDLREGHVSYVLDGTMGVEPQVSAGLDVPLREGLSIQVMAQTRREVEFDFHGDDRRSEVAIATSEARLALAYRPSRGGELLLGGFVGTNDDVDHRGAPLDVETGAYRGLFARAAYDTTDEPIVPRRGTRAWLETRGYDGLDRALVQASGDMETFVGSKGDAVGLRASFGTSFGANAPFAFEFRPRLDAYRRDEIRDDGFVALGLTETHSLAPLPFALGRIFLQTRFQTAFAEGRSFPGASLGILGDTRAGTAYVGVGFAEHGAVRLLLTLGRRF